MSFAIVMMTVDRVPRPNYLRTTLDNLERAGVFSTPLLHSFNLFNSYADSQRYIYEAIGSRPITVWHPQVGRRRATENAAEALRLGGKYREADWVLFLEDDIDVIKNFLESLQDWLERHKDKSLIFPLGANYEELVYLARLGVVEAWDYHLALFYGTLALAMRPAVATEVSIYYGMNPRDQTYDLLLAKWARAQGATHFVTPVPSFVQHIGKESSIRPGSNFIEYESWPGRRWRYQPTKEHHDQTLR